jgi:hypothetical protein
LLSFYFLLPFVFVVFNKLQNYKDKAIPGIMLLAYCLIIGANFFNSYPVKDDYFNAKFVNLSQADIDSVKFIEEKSESPHIVLANQMVGAAAIKEFGFKNYYNNDFYYSLPGANSNSIYLNFENIAEKQAKNAQEIRLEMQTAMRKAGVKESFLVLNSYWKNFEKLSAMAKKAAIYFEEINRGINTNIIFYFQIP